MTQNEQSLSLQTLLADESVAFRVHNVKLTQVSCKADLPQMFLAHYDQLSDEIKEKKPITPLLFKQLGTLMSAAQAQQMLGIDSGIPVAQHIKISGTTVLACDELSLALHLNFTNTAKPNQPCYGNNIPALLQEQAALWQMTGNVNVLNKSISSLVSHTLHEEVFEIEKSDGYTRLPNAHALATTHTINTLKDRNPERFTALSEAIIERVAQWDLSAFQ